MNRRPRAAFSLVEVVLAMGVISFAIVAILAFFPAGLASNRSSMTETRAAQIVRAITGTIDSQCSTFTSINCYGLNLDLSSLSTLSTPPSTNPNTLYASYPTPNQPVISSTKSNDSIYSIDLLFDNDPPFNPAGAGTSVKLGPGKTNLIQIRVYNIGRNETPTEFFFIARNKG